MNILRLRLLLQDQSQTQDWRASFLCMMAITLWLRDRLLATLPSVDICTTYQSSEHGFIIRFAEHWRNWDSGGCWCWERSSSRSWRWFFWGWRVAQCFTLLDGTDKTVRQTFFCQNPPGEFKESLQKARHWDRNENEWAGGHLYRVSFFSYSLKPPYICIMQERQLCTEHILTNVVSDKKSSVSGHHESHWGILHPPPFSKYL